MKVSITAAELPALLDRAPAGVRVLSLDCFDTLLWRNVQAPVDGFADLGMAGGGAWVRGRAEKRPRVRAAFDGPRSEVSIEEIYDCLYPAASARALGGGVGRGV